MRLATGARVGPYEITGTLGAGGMGEVYRARDARLQREVALKVLPAELAADRGRLARFEREARTASALNHPNIVTIHEFGEYDGETFLVMELVRGESLREVIARGPLPVKRALAIALGIADALAAAHAAGIVHRDLKPENVMISGDGSAKLLDFGLVKREEVAEGATDTHLSEPGAVFGTVAYMAPEQARGEPVDYRADGFSFGLVLQEMLTGRHPFARKTAVETAAAIISEPPEPLDIGVPESVAAIVERCLANEPGERYASTLDLAHDVRRARRTGNAQPRAVSASSSWTRRMAAASIGGALLLGIALGGWVRLSPREPPREPLVASVTTPDIARVHFGEIANPVVISPNGRYLAISGALPQGGNAVWVHDLMTGTTRLFAEPAFAPGWSPRSDAIAYFAGGKLKARSLDGAPPRDICDARPEGNPVWHGDDILYPQFSQDPGLYRVNAAGGAPQRLIESRTREDARVALWPSFLPDGRHFLFFRFGRRPTGGFESELMVASLDGGEPQRLGPRDSRAEFADGQLLFVRDGTLLAQPFDPVARRFTGDAQPLIPGVHFFARTGHAAFSASSNGRIAWRTVRDPVRLAWYDRTGSLAGSIGDFVVGSDGRLSPDGSRYAVGIIDPKSGISDLWVYDLGRESMQRITSSARDEKSPVWAPDGGLFYRSDGAGGPPDIFRLMPGQDAGAPFYEGLGINEPEDVSRDGRLLAFVDYDQTGGGDIKMISVDDPASPQTVLATVFNEEEPRFSPDGLSLAYVSNESGRPEVYIRRMNGREAPVKISRDGAVHPRWRTDGSELYFLGPNGRVMSVDTRKQVGTPRLLFQAPGASDFEVVPDGSRFLVQVDERPQNAVFRVMSDWPAALVRK